MRGKTPERGSIIVLFALLMPVLIVVGAIVISVGNWYVLKRHLQTQVDAAALAGGPAATGCSQTPAVATAAVAQQALRYAGDPTRDATTDNLLPQDSPDVHVILNGSEYWKTGDPTDDTNDWTIEAPGTPCDTKYLDVKATDDSAPLLWDFVPYAPSLEARARVRFSEVQSSDGVLPLGVPELNPEEVAVLIVDENGDPDLASTVRGATLLDPQSTSPSGLEDMSVWSKSFVSADLSGSPASDFGVVIVASRSSTTLPLNGTLSQICDPSSGQVECYGGDQLDDGISFVHAYSTTGTGSASNPIVRGVSLSGGCTNDLSKPYFNLEGGCPLTITAEVDFGTGSADPRPRASNGGVCAELTSPQVQGGGQLSWAGGLWTGTVDPSGSGPTSITLSWKTDVIGACNNQGDQSGSFGKVAMPYAGDTASGPVQYLALQSPTGGSGNSLPQSATATVNVTVGLVPPLRENNLAAPPIVLRGWVEPSQSQAVDCGNGSGPNGWGGAMQDGCADAYQVYDESKHTAACVPAIEPPDCIDAQNGNYKQASVIDMLRECDENPNRWDGMNVPPLSDKRWVPLFILDQMAFEVSGKRTYPVRRFGMFYVTATSGFDCPGDDPDYVGSEQLNKEEIWGHFLSFVSPGLGNTIPSDIECSFQAGTLCVSNLVE